MADLDRYVLTSFPEGREEEKAFSALRQAHSGDSFNLVQAAEILSRNRIRVAVIETLIDNGSLELAE